MAGMSGDTLRDSAGRELAEGAKVTYHGSLTACHGEWTIKGPCLCEECFARYAMTGEHRLVLSSPASERPLAHVSQSSVTLTGTPAAAPGPEVTQLWQALPGDVISVHGQYPSQVTVLSLDAADPDGHFLILAWASAAGEGRRQLTSAARIILVSRPGAAGKPPPGAWPPQPGAAP
jgi:hypothetical protein